MPIKPVCLPADPLTSLSCWAPGRDPSSGPGGWGEGRMRHRGVCPVGEESSRSCSDFPFSTASTWCYLGRVTGAAGKLRTDSEWLWRAVVQPQLGAQELLDSNFSVSGTVPPPGPNGCSGRNNSLGRDVLRCGVLSSDDSLGDGSVALCSAVTICSVLRHCQIPLPKEKLIQGRKVYAHVLLLVSPSVLCLSVVPPVFPLSLLLSLQLYLLPWS